jgi:hypothetical protein
LYSRAEISISSPSRRQHQDQRLDPLAAQVAADVEAAAAGQHHVEQHEVEVLLESGALAGLAIARRADLIALGLETIGEGQGEAGLVLDEQQPRLRQPLGAQRLRQHRGAPGRPPGSSG